MVKYVVRITSDEREQLRSQVNAGRAAAVKLFHTRILLKTDVDASECHWTDAEMAAALDTSVSTVHRVRQAWVAQRMDAVLSRKPPTGR
jgi:hypothetical protein